MDLSQFSQFNGSTSTIASSCLTRSTSVSSGRSPMSSSTSLNSDINVFDTGTIQGNDELEIVIGVLALQGAFIEHEAILRRLSSSFTLSQCPFSFTTRPWKFSTIQVRTVGDLNRCTGLVIPGGESTTIALLARLANLLEPLRLFARTKPIWGTCAGAILLAQEVANPKKGGQEVLGGVAVRVARNGWGSQVESFEAPLEVPTLRGPDRPFLGVFIRAPVVLSRTEETGDSPIEVVARLNEHLLPASLDYDAQVVTAPPLLTLDCTPHSNHVQIGPTVVALRQGYHLLTTFHPELTEDDRFHEYFVKECIVPYVISQTYLQEQRLD